VKKQASTFEYRLDQATTFQDAKGKDLSLPPNTRLIYEGYDDEGYGQFSVTAGKEKGRKLRAEAVDPDSFRGGAADECRNCGTALTADLRSQMVPDLCSGCEDAGTF
jgi:hypothetical protein